MRRVANEKRNKQIEGARAAKEKRRRQKKDKLGVDASLPKCNRGWRKREKKSKLAQQKPTQRRRRRESL